MRSRVNNIAKDSQPKQSAPLPSRRELITRDYGYFPVGWLVAAPPDAVPGRPSLSRKESRNLNE